MILIVVVCFLAVIIINSTTVGLSFTYCYIIMYLFFHGSKMSSSPIVLNHCGEEGWGGGWGGGGGGGGGV